MTTHNRIPHVQNPLRIVSDGFQLISFQIVFELFTDYFRFFLDGFRLFRRVRFSFSASSRSPFSLLLSLSSSWSSSLPSSFSFSLFFGHRRHRHKTHWGPNALQFSPERWIDRAPGSTDEAWLPFGLGPRKSEQFLIGLVDLFLPSVQFSSSSSSFSSSSPHPPD